MKKSFMLLDVDYFTDNNASIIRLFGVDESNANVFIHIEFDPYLLVLPKKIDDKIKKKILGVKEPKIKRIEETEKIIGTEKKKLLKVYAYRPQDVPKIRDVLKKFEEIGHENCFEYSINFAKRFLIDNQFSPGSWFEADLEEKNGRVFAKKIKSTEAREAKIKKIAFDIESYEEGGKSIITMISFLGGNFKKVLTYKEGSYPEFVEVVKDEKELLERFVEVIREQNPDIIFGYNSDEFDFKLIDERAKEHKVKLVLGRDGSEMKFTRRARISAADIQGRIHIDLFNFVSNILSPRLETEVLTLGEVSSEILQDEKIEMQLEDIFESWRDGKNLGKLAEYCLKDSELAFKLGEFLLPQIFELSRLIGQAPFDVSRMTYSQLVEWYLSKRAFALERVIPNQPKFDEIQKRRMRKPYEGGFVKEPTEGLYDNIAVLDFKSLYPTIIATHNISPETFNCSCCKGEKVPGLDYHFCKKKKGFISLVIGELVEKRSKLKKQLSENPSERLKLEEMALKITTNATYGYLAFVSSKWYCFECAESAAAYGRYYIKKIIEEAEKEGFKVIYGDTDSVFLTSGNIEEKSMKFLEKINGSLPGIMELDFQGIYRRGIFVSTRVGKGAKKRYALIDEKGNLTIRGFETVRRDWCSLAKKVQREVLKYILMKNDTNGAVGYVRNIIGAIKERKIDLRDFIIYEQLTKPLNEYEQVGPHVSAARKMKESGNPVGPGSIIMFVIREGSGSISERAEPFEVMSAEKIDINYYINNQIIPAAMRVLSALGVSEDELKGEGKQTGLKKFYTT